jgi:signal transduction histidine kinase
MLKTIFSKLVAMFVFILALAFIITGVTLNYFLEDFLTQEKTSALEESIDIIHGTLVDFMNNRSDPIAAFYFGSSFQVFSKFTDSYIWVVDSTGHILRSQPELPEELIYKWTDDTGYVKLPVVEQYSKVMKQTDAVREIGDFYGFFNDAAFKRIGQDAARLTIEKSYVYVDRRGTNTKMAIYMHTPVPEVQAARISIFKFYLLSVATAVLISIMLVYVFSLRLTRPLKEIRKAAKIIAGGEFKKRLNIKSRDEIGQLAQSFDQMAAALQNIEEMRRGFIANVSHELRTPMTSIRGFIEGILDGTIPQDRQSYYLTIVRDETNRLNRLVNNLLDLAKMEAGELELKPRIFNVNELVRVCVIKLETLITDKNIQVEAIFEDEDVYASADVDAIERVLYNLVHNAIKFTPEEGRIKIATVKRKETVEVSVEDNGIGINPDELDMIWERFYKADKSRSRDKVGTGLGLAIVKTIINEHHQDIWVESAPGKGTKFTFTLRRMENPENL